jgi:hypothetical protein
MPNTIFGAFDQGVAPVIAVINKATVDLGCDFLAMTDALQKYIDDAFAPIWGTPAKLVVSDTEISSAWSFIFLDDADAANALGYHELTTGGLPLSKIFVKTTLAGGEKVSVTASHEIAEMLIDPAINLWALGPDDVLYAYETADAVEEETFEIDGIPMSDFVYPAYFEGFREPGSRPFDYLRKVTRPFEILRNGYSITMKHGQMGQIFGSREKADRFAKEDRRMHRGEYRREIVKQARENSAAASLQTQESQR